MTTKKNLSMKISTETDISLSESQKITNYLIKIIKNNVYNKNVKIHSFGTFYVHKSPKRFGRNPKTKESYIIQPRLKINFKSSNKIKRILN